MFRTTLLVLCIIFVSINISVGAENINIYINGDEKTDVLQPISENDCILSNAQSTADEFNADINWLSSIKTLSISNDDTVVKMMQNSPYIQINNDTQKSKGKLQIIDGHTYLPLEEISEAFGYLYKREGDNIYISRPKSFVDNISWQKEGQQLVVEMDKISPYRVNNTEDPRRIEIELEQAALAKDFTDGLSNKNFYLKVDSVDNQARLKVTIISNYPIPFHRDRSIQEDGNNLVIDFLPYIKGIEWKKEQLDIITNGVIKDPEIKLMQNPRRMVIDIPDVMLTEFDLKIPENEWIKDVRVSQFKYDPIILRVVVELHPDRYLYLDEGKGERLVFQTTQRTTIENLEFENNQISFISDKELNPDIFTLNDPDRVVVNILNAFRGDNFLDAEDVNSDIVKSIRTSRFNDETIRMVVDMKKDIGYSLTDKNISDGKIKYIISFENDFREMIISDSPLRTDVKMSFTGNVEYELLEFENPSRVAVDVEGVKLEEKPVIPDPAGIIESIRVSQFSTDPDIVRFVFETEDYKNHQFLAVNNNNNINLSFVKQSEQRPAEDVIVVDAGHGGFDPGAIGPSGLQEKGVNLDIALKVKKLLESKGHKVLLSRSDDTFISLKDRVNIANEAKAVLFVSIHANSSNTSYTEGTETFIAPEKVTDSLPLARFLQEEMLKDLNREDRGVKKDNLYVIRHTTMPAALVEVAFLSNPHEESLLESRLFIEKAAQAISRGIIKYIEEH
ncbi:MAG: N-acetylmuramoyl-L-alanine amidase [Bacillota bacterium]